MTEVNNLTCPRCNCTDFREVDCGPDTSDDDISYTSDICVNCGLWHDGWTGKWYVDCENWRDTEDATEFIETKKPISELKDWELKLDILAFAWTNDLMIHPDKDLDGFCKRTVSVRHCPCKDHELFCPCDEALAKCEEQGYCTCRLFITKMLYPEALVKSRERLGKKDERKRESKSIRR